MNFPLRDLYVREICRVGDLQVGGLAGWEARRWEACRLGGLHFGRLMGWEAYGLGGLQARFDVGLSLEGDRPQSI